MKIVFITSSYYPYFSAIGKCINNLVNELKKEHELIVISNMTTINLQNQVVFDDHKIIRVRTKSMKERDNILAQNKNTNQLNKVINKIKMQLLRIHGYLEVVMSRETIHKPLVNEYFKALSTIEDADVIIPTCYPFESIIAAQKYKNNINKNVRIIPFLFDKYSDSPTLHRSKINKILKYKRHLSLEKEMIKDSEKILYVDSWVYQMKKNFANYSQKSSHVEHPLIIDSFSEYYIENDNVDSNYIDIVYTGVIDKKVRPPFETLKIISRMIEKNNRLRFHFYVLGNCVNKINSYQMKYPNNIFNHGQVKSEVALSKIMKSNILLSIGNTDISLIPSKIFEYMSCGKPIIHFFNSNQDRVIKMLNDYGLGYCVEQTSNISEEKVNAIVKFCEDNSSNKRTFEEVKRIFYKATPQYISEILLDGLVERND